MIFDTHAHYDDEVFDSDREELLRTMVPGGVGRILDMAATPESLEKVVEIAESHYFIYGAVGLHPDEAGKLTDKVCMQLRKLLERRKIVAVGEIGLDYHWDVWPHDVQAEAFRKQMLIALDYDVPICVHSRAANLDTFEMLTDMYGSGRGREAIRKGVIHAYPGSLEQAKIYTEMGFYLGIGGVVTYRTSKKLKKVVDGIPLKHLLLETDCPYLSPETKKGERNTSLNLHEVVRAIAEIKGVTEEEVEKVTWDNATRLFL